MNSKFMKICSIVLTIALLINLLPMQVLGAEFNSLFSDSEAASENWFYTNQMGDPGEATIVEEITDARTEYSKEYLMSNGLNMIVVYPEAVHYEENNEWKEIDNTLKAVGTGANASYINTAGEWTVSFPQQLNSSKTVSISRDGYTLSFGLAGELTIPEFPETSVMSVEKITDINEPAQQFSVDPGTLTSAVIEDLDLSSLRESMEYPETFVESIFSQLKYNNVYGDTDIVYDLSSRTVKESIVIESYDAELYGYRYTLNTGTMVPVLEDDGSITLYAPDKTEIVMSMPAPYMIDNSGETSFDIDVTLEPSESGYILTYHMPMEWLADDDRAWPVVLDPIVEAGTSTSNILDHFVAEYYSASNSSGSLMCGYYPDFGKMRTFIKFSNIPTLSAADVIVNATLSLTYLGGTTGTTTIGAHKVNSNWTTGSITWANQPSHDDTIEDYAHVGNSGSYSWNITDIARGWYETQNTGVMLKALDTIENGTANNWKKFYSVDYSVYNTERWPSLIIQYRNASGIESYWDYTAHGAGRAGTGYINNYSGNLVWVRTDLGFGGTRMPVSISHVYNANSVTDNTLVDYGMGTGWRTNYNQRAYQPSGAIYYIWEDGDGTKHYFYPKTDGTGYIDEDGLELTLKVDNSYVTIQDKNGNTSYFNLSNGRLQKMENNQYIESDIDITYTSSSSYKIASIKDGVNRTYNFTYNSSGLLDKITYVGKGSTEISSVQYVYSGTNLYRIIDKDQEYSEFGYSGSYLTTVTDIDGYQLAYSYNSRNQIASVQEKQLKDGQNAVLGGSLEITYTQNQTKFVDHNENVQIMQFNDWGNTISIQDGEGRAQYAQYALNNSEDSSKSETDKTLKANQLRISSRMQNTVCNMEFGGNFENGITGWYSLNGSVTLSSSTAYSYYGDSSMKLVRSTAGTISGVYGCPIIVEEHGWPTLTFSAYVKTDPGANVLLGFGDEDGNVFALSEAVAGNTDWTRLQVSYTPAGAPGMNTIHPVVLTTNAGTVYVDCVQLEVMPTASRFNLLDYGDHWGEYFLDEIGAWTKSNGMTEADDSYDSQGNHPTEYMEATVLRITGDPAKQKYVSQTITQSGIAGDCYVLAGWGYGNSVPAIENTDGTKREFGLRITFNYTDGSSESQFATFNANIPEGEHWQYTATPAVAQKAYSSITVQVVYNYGANTVLFDGIQLFKESFGSSYDYDEDGNLKTVTDLQNTVTDYEYENNNLTTILENNKAKMRYEYDDYHNVTKAVTQTKDSEGNIVDGIVYEFYYDPYGNNTQVRVVNGDMSISTFATYTDDFNRMETSADDLANVTTYGYNENTNVLEWVQYPNDTETSRTTYTYDNMYRMASAATNVSGLSTGTALTANYVYSNDMLTAIETGSTTYSFSYGDFAQRSNIKIGSRTLASYTYTNDQNRYLDRLTYGNGDTVDYEYDNDGRVTLETFEDGSTVSYEYDNTGALATMTDSKTGRKTTYYYDLTDRLMKYVESSSGYGHDVTYTYDGLNNLTKLVETINGVKHTTEYTYDYQNRLTETKYNDLANGNDVTEEVQYDEYGRLFVTRVKNNGSLVLGSWFQYAYGNSTYSDTSRLGRVEVSTPSGYVLSSSYDYDNNGNIISYNMSGGNDIEWWSLNTDTPVRMGASNYHYDGANQLVREDNMWLNKTFVWTYDDAGNITSCKEYPYTYNWEPVTGTPTKTNTYTYGDSAWGDLLTAYNGVQWSYDQIGNLTNDGTWGYTWQNGRELASMSNGSTTWNYTYDANGLRTSRSNGTKTYNYVYDGSQLTQMTVGNDTLYFTYGAIGPTTVTWNGTTYYYAVNGQGDVIGIFDGSGNCVVNYNWDNAWGYNPEPEGTMADTLGTLNPLRYRSYVYDEETELYYLNTRYYNPEICRFINADIYPTTGQGLTGNNMFAYCGNNPVNRKDDGGEFWNIVIGAVVGAVVSAATTAIQSYKETGSIDIGKTVISGLVGAVSGGVAATGLGMVAQAAITAGTAFVGDVATQKICENKSWGEINYTKAAHNGVLAGGTSMIGSVLGGITSGGHTITGNSLISSGKDKLLTGYVRKSVGQSYSKLIKQGSKLVATGTKYINTGRGISSVTGTLLTWGIGQKYSWS